VARGCLTEAGRATAGQQPLGVSADICDVCDFPKIHSGYPGWKPEVSLAGTIKQIAAAT